MKYDHLHVLLLLIACPTLLLLNPHVNKSEPPKPQKKNAEQVANLKKVDKKTYWDCYVNGKYTKVSVIEGEIFKATLETEHLGMLILHGVGDTRDQLFGSIEKKGEFLAIGTFQLSKVVAIGESQPKHTLLGELKIIADNSLHSIKFSPME